MRELTEIERVDLARRRTQFDSFLEERIRVLKDFVERIGLGNAPMVLVEADTFLPDISRFMKFQQIAPKDRAWILTRIGYFIGEWLVQRYGGCWFLNDVPDTRYFLRNVVGRFTCLSNYNAMVDPFAIAEAFVDSPCPRLLINILADVETELRLIGLPDPE